MEKKLFTGVAQNGDFATALQHALNQALESLRTDFIQWELESTSGKYGGFVQEHTISVTIRVGN